MQELYREIDALPVLLPLWTGTVAIGFVSLGRARRLTRGRAVTVLVGAGYVVAVIALTFFPLRVTSSGVLGSGSWLGQLNLLPVVTIDAFTFALNVVMTVPLGMLAPLVVHMSTVRSAALVGLGASATIEGLQLLGNIMLGSGRVVDVNDLLANVAGAVLGWLLLQHLRRAPALARLVASLVLRRSRCLQNQAPSRLGVLL